jgi:hypothetical protein
LGGKFSEVGNAILTPDLIGKIPNKLYIPVHDNYNMTSRRIEKIADILDRNLRKIFENNDYFVIVKNL